MRSIVLVFRKPFDSSYSILFLFDELLKTFKDQSIEVTKYTVPFHSKGFVRRAMNTFSLLFFQNKIVHITGDIYYSILGAWFSRRVITIHDLSFLYRTSGLSHLILKWFWVKLPCLFANKITVISHATRIDLLKYVELPDTKLAVVYDFVDERFKEAKRTFNCICPRILQVGCSFNKNIERLILSLEGLDCELVIVGRLSDAQFSLLKERKIKYHNFFDLSIEDLHQQYLNADLLCYVSIMEGFGMPIIEAQATGLPVVTSNCSSMPEVAGNGAVLVDPFNIESIKSGIVEIIQNQESRERLVREGYSNVKRFSREQIALDYQKVYQSL